MEKCQVCIIVPALNEAERIARLLRRLNAMPHVGEIVVCDGGSSDATREIARELGARVLSCEANRGAQMNAGAAVARGEVLWFLHADALPPRSGASRIMAACGRKSPHRVLDIGARAIVGGNFRLRFESSGKSNSVRVASRVFATVARGLRSCGVYYGDSGIWMRREVFEQIGAFQPWPLFEDYEMARRLESYARRNHCSTVCIAPPVVVSSRRFGSSTRSAAQLLARWAKLQALFWAGVAPETLSKMYRGK